MVTFLIVVPFSIGMGGAEWMVSAWPWALIVIVTAFLLAAGKNSWVAGAEWFRFNRRYVRMYELTSVTIGRDISKGGRELILRDTGGRKVATSMADIQQNPCCGTWSTTASGTPCATERRPTRRPARTSGCSDRGLVLESRTIDDIRPSEPVGCAWIHSRM